VWLLTRDVCASSLSMFETSLFKNHDFLPGAALDSTPDGKEGGHSYAVRHNLASFVMDQPGRGRSGFSDVKLKICRIS
jgi:hypothetical protein